MDSLEPDSWASIKRPKLADVRKDVDEKEHCSDGPSLLSSTTSLLGILDNSKPMMMVETVKGGGAPFQQIREDLLLGALQTKQEGPSVNTVSAWKTGLRWWARFCLDVGLPELLDFPVGLAAGRFQVVNFTLMFLEYVAQHSKGKGPTGAALPSTSSRYLVPVRAIHLDLGVDLRFTLPYVKQWEAGREKFLRRTAGIRVVDKKVGVTRAMMMDCFSEDWGYLGDAHMQFVGKTIFQYNFQMLFRRSELLLKSGDFDFNLHLTRNHLKFYDVHWVRFPPTKEFLTRLLREGGWILSYSPVLKNDPTGKIWGNAPTPFRIQSAASSVPRFIDCVPWLIQMELNDLMPDEDLRKVTPLFVDTATKTTLRVAKFDQVFINVLRASYARKRIFKSEAEVRKILSLHSIRIGGLNAYKKAKAPVHARKSFGRWTSRAVFGYERDDLEELADYVEGQDVDCELSQAVDPDMPTWPQARNAEPGPFELSSGEEVDDLSVVEEAQGYLAQVRRREVGGQQPQG